MSDPQVTLRLEYVVRNKDHAGLVEPLLFVREFHPVAYQQGALNSLQGDPVLALQVKGQLDNVPVHKLFRVRAETDPDLEGDPALTNAKIQCSAVKVVWEGDKFTLAYVFQEELSRSSTAVMATTLSNATNPWHFVLVKQQGAGGPEYTLLMVEQNSQGGVDACLALEDDGIDCSHPPSDYWEKQCDAKRC